MSKSELPAEFGPARLNHAQLIRILRLIDRETVIVRFTLRADPIRQKRLGRPASSDSCDFANHDCSDGGCLFLDQATVERASLCTFDGNDYFSTVITTLNVQVEISDADSTGP